MQNPPSLCFKQFFAELEDQGYIGKFRNVQKKEAIMRACQPISKGHPTSHYHDLSNQRRSPLRLLIGNTFATRQSVGFKIFKVELTDARKQKVGTFLACLGDAKCMHYDMCRCVKADLTIDNIVILMCICILYIYIYILCDII